MCGHMEEGGGMVTYLEVATQLGKFLEVPDLDWKVLGIGIEPIHSH